MEIKEKNIIEKITENSLFCKIYNNKCIEEILLKIDILKNNLSNLNLNEEILKNGLIKENNIIITNSLSICNLILLNDGSMTNFLQVLIDSKNKKKEKVVLNMNLLINKSYNIQENFQMDKFLREISEKFCFLIKSEKIIVRIIEFFYNQNLLTNDQNSPEDIFNIMYGISFWDELKYNSLYETEEEKKKPIGIILKEKKIEFYKETENFYIRNPLSSEEINYQKSHHNFFEDLIIIVRLTKFYKNKEIYFFLIETFELNKLLQLINI